jgi:D-psicose/D-tagatose/L-ribulose 3-epimerase
MPRYGAHAFVWIGAWNTEDGNHAIAQAGQVGFDFIEIPLLKPETFDAESHRAALKQAGIGATCSLVLPKGTQMATYPEKAKTFLYAALEKVEQVGSQYLGGCIAYELGTLTGKAPTKQERETVIDVLKDVAAEAKRRGITLALEAYSRCQPLLAKAGSL